MILIRYPQAAEWLEGVLQISYYRLAQLVLLRYSGLVILGAVSKYRSDQVHKVMCSDSFSFLFWFCFCCLSAFLFVCVCSNLLVP